MSKDNRKGNTVKEADRILRVDEVMHRTGLGRTTLWRLERDGDFPRRRRLSPSGQAVGWIESEVNEWIESRDAVESGRG